MVPVMYVFIIIRALEASAFLKQKGKEQILGNKVNMQRSRTRVLDLLELYSHTHTTLLIVQQRLIYIPQGLGF